MYVLNTRFSIGTHSRIRPLVVNGRFDQNQLMYLFTRRGAIAGLAFKRAIVYDCQDKVKAILVG